MDASIQTEPNLNFSAWGTGVHLLCMDWLLNRNISSVGILAPVTVDSEVAEVDLK